jgi:hypothetical protein
VVRCSLVGLDGLRLWLDVVWWDLEGLGGAQWGRRGSEALGGAQRGLKGLGGAGRGSEGLGGARRAGPCTLLHVTSTNISTTTTTKTTNQKLDPTHHDHLGVKKSLEPAICSSSFS